jgi:hypothetical protein
VKTADPGAPDTASSAAATSTSKPKTADTSGKSTRPPAKTPPKPNVVYTPD